MACLTILTDQIDGIVLDCTFSEDISTAIRHSKKNVETGIDITDHASFEAIVIKIHSAISNHDINSGRYRPDRIAQDYDRLISIQKQLKLLTIDTGISSHSNMIMSELKRTRTNDAGEVLDFSCTFTEVRFAENPQIVSAISVGGGVGNSTGSAASGGGGTGKEAGTVDAGSSKNSAVTQRERSGLIKILDSIN